MKPHGLFLGTVCIALTAITFLKMTHAQAVRAPTLINECETSVSTICGVWTLTGTNYIAQWQNGARAQLYIQRFDSGGIVITRSDTSGISAGMTARYTGQPTGNSVSGEVVWVENGFSKKGTWNANW